MKLEAYVAGGVGQDSALLRKIAEHAGGYTVTPHFGGWVNSEGVLIEEQSSVITVFTDTPSVIEALVLSAAARRGEEAVAFAVSDPSFFIESTGVKVGRS